jgi:hypothetical protein
MKAAALRLTVQQANDIKREPVAIPEWGLSGEDAIIVKGLTGAEREEYEQSCLKPGEAGQPSEVIYKDMKIKLVIRSCYDHEDKRIFMDSDASWLGEKSAMSLQRLYNVAAKLSALSAEDVKELAKNSVSVQGVASVSVSPLPSDAPLENS